MGVPPGKQPGTSGSIMGWRWGAPQEGTRDQWKYYGMEIGVSPAPECGHTDACQNITFPGTSHAGGNKMKAKWPREEWRGRPEHNF